MEKYIRPTTGTVWIMVTDDEDLQDMNGLLCLVTDFDGREGSNGDDDVSMLYINGTTFPQKERRFVGRHKYIGTVEEVGKFIHEKFGSNTEAINNYLSGYVLITGCRIKCWHTTATHLVFYVGEEEYRVPLARIEGYKTK